MKGLRSTAESFFSSAPSQSSSALLSRLARSLGLPQDSLSTALLQFARFFSLPYRAESMKELRREALGQAFGTEGRTLAAVAAASKGVKLSGEALRRFAAYLDPALRGSAETGGTTDGNEEATAKRQVRGIGDREGSAGQSGSGSAGDGTADQERSSPKDRDGNRKETAPPGFPLDDLRTAAEGEGGLALLNRLAEGNGRRWVIIPFGFLHDGIDFTGTLRLLLIDNSSPQEGKSRAESFALDLLCGSSRWLFRIQDAGASARKAVVTVDPPLPSDKAIRTLEALRRALTAVVDDVSWGLDFDPYADCRPEGPVTVDEAV